MNTFPQTRLRRLRRTQALRDLVQETQLTPHDLIMPLFIKEGLDERKAISSMPGQYQLPLNQLAEEAKAIYALGIPAVILFGIPSHKDAEGSDAYNANGIIARSIAVIKEACPELLVIADTCFCEYTDHGHCGSIDTSPANLTVDNDTTLSLLSRQAVIQAQAGADIIAPSGMMDGMVQAIRNGLDEAHFQHIPILSYAAKYASSFYGPFREAAEGTPQFGDRRTYQMDPGNSNEALREVALDIAEGADMLMVKPALAYLDIIQKIHQQYPEVPLAAYQVSGEYAMIKAAAERGWLDEKKVIQESLLSIKRAGANMIISYFAKDFAQSL